MYQVQACTEYVQCESGPFPISHRCSTIRSLSPHFCIPQRDLPTAGAIEYLRRGRLGHRRPGVARLRRRSHEEGTGCPRPLHGPTRKRLAEEQGARLRLEGACKLLVCLRWCFAEPRFGRHPIGSGFKTFTAQSPRSAPRAPVYLTEDRSVHALMRAFT